MVTSFSLDENHSLMLQLGSIVLRGGWPVVNGSAGNVLEIRYWLENLPTNFALDAFGLRFTAIDNLRLYLPMGYT